MSFTLLNLAAALDASEARIEKMASQGHFAPADKGGARRARLWSLEEGLHVGSTLKLVDRGIPVAEAAFHARKLHLADYQSNRFLVVWKSFWVGISDPRHPGHNAWKSGQLGEAVSDDSTLSSGEWSCEIVDFDEVTDLVREFGTVTIISLGELRCRLEDRGVA